MKIFLTIFLFFICRISCAQNLVPNGSFEDTISCPIFQDDINLAVGWSSYSHSPDYCNSCDTGGVGVPSNIWGYQYAKIGTAYAGLICYFSPTPNFREYIGIHLSQGLTIGQRYYVSFYTVMAFNQTHRIGIASNKIGIKMSTIPYSANVHAPTDNLSQVYSDSIISDTLNWTKISGSFIADSTYEYLIIGVFFTDALTSFISLDPLALYSYYYIDDIRLSTDSNYVNSLNEIRTVNPIEVFPNPFFDKINITVPNNESSEIILCDIIGRKVIQQKFNNSISLSTEQLEKGIYLYVIRNKNEVIKKGKVVKE